RTVPSGRGWRQGRSVGAHRAGRDRLDLKLTTNRRQLAHARVVDPRGLDRPASEAILRHSHDRVVHVDVAVHVDVGHVDGRGAIDDDVVHDARATPAAPPGDADESRTTPPWDDRLA